VAAVLAAAAVTTFMPGLVAPWSRLNNEEQELDLVSGRTRFTRHFLYCRVRRDVRATPLSEALAASGAPESGEEWVRVNIFQPGVRHSPHFIYHGAFGNAKQIQTFWELYSFDRQARAKSARQLLRAMREGGSYFAGSDYLDLLKEALGPYPSEGQATSAERIPDDLTERVLAERAEQARQQ
jgi:hypothetical protein